MRKLKKLYNINGFDGYDNVVVISITFAIKFL